ncbi:glycosyltransferase N-terminal domain-containing protein [Acidomonas methanolica]|uniref:glycosyltransferase N-terminal domain-containing protein n=1 Tax=Acidomonas methanolica TaxID=437 RepID=UPI002119D6EF|nr:DUF374 domain-containing protein [Acidomonas methanolica]
MSRFIDGLASRAARAWLRLALRTTRWTVTGAPAAVPILRQENAQHGAIVAFWHHSLLQLAALWHWVRDRHSHLHLHVVVSRNRDGRLLADAIAPWGIVGIAGSSARKGKEKGGSRAFRQALTVLKDGCMLAITPDGPRGPARVVQPGVVALSRLAHRPVVPVGAACHALRLPSWDRLAIPLPFGRGEIVLASPLDPPASTEDLASALNAAQAEAERRHATSGWSAPERLWALLGTLLAPPLIVMLRIRLARGRELEDRLRERLGLTRARRPRGPLLWVHAASVGECRSALPLIDALLELRPGLSVLMTTATVTGAGIAAAHFAASPPERAARLRHQFIPYDVPRWSRRFLNRWRPDAALFVESEIWPGLIAACDRRGIPVAIVNGRLSDRSARRWARLKRLATRLYGRLSFVAARGAEDAARFRTLGVRECTEYGDLKQAAPPPPVPQDAMADLRAAIGARPVLLAASTHPGEEEMIAEAARLLRETRPDLLCIIAPRHPVRAGEIAAGLGHPPRRSQGKLPGRSDSLYLADTLGELGLLYRLATVAWLGNAHRPPGGGHNPYEPVRLGVPLATGPHIDNFRPAFARLAGHVAVTHDAGALADWAGPLLGDDARRREIADGALKAIGAQEEVSAQLLTRIAFMLPA